MSYGHFEIDKINFFYKSIKSYAIITYVHEDYIEIESKEMNDKLSEVTKELNKLKLIKVNACVENTLEVCNKLNIEGVVNGQIVITYNGRPGVTPEIIQKIYGDVGMSIHVAYHNLVYLIINGKYFVAIDTIFSQLQFFIASSEKNLDIILRARYVYIEGPTKIHYAPSNCKMWYEIVYPRPKGGNKRSNKRNKRTKMRRKCRRATRSRKKR